MNLPHSVCIASQIAEIDYWKNRLQSGGVLFFCSNRETYQHCLKSGFQGILLDEKVIQADYSEINQWAYTKILELTAAYPENSHEHLFLLTHFFDVKCLFIQTLKYIRVLEYYFQQNPAEDVYISNARPLELMRAVCEGYYADKKRIHFFSIPVQSQRFKFKTALNEFLRFIAAALCNFWTGLRLQRFASDKNNLVAVSGSLIHLRSVVETLQESRSGVVFCENLFNLPKAIYCFKKGIGFLIFKKPSSVENPFSRVSWPEAVLMEYRNVCLKGVLKKVFQKSRFFDFKSCGFSPLRVESFFRKQKPQAVLLDEDFSIRRTWAVVSQRMRTPCFVISHGIPIVPIKTQTNGIFPLEYFSAKTFIQSDFEKKAYEQIFYNPRNLLLKGIPRYDRLQRIMKENPEFPSQNPKVLFCAATLIPYDFTDVSAAWDVLGTHTLSKSYTIGYVKDLLGLLPEAAKAAKLIIKPHYFDGALWKQILEELDSSGGRYELCAYDADIFQLLAQASLVVTTPSTVITEALMLDKDIIVLNYDGPEELLSEYTRRGVVLTAKSPEDLKVKLKELFTDSECRERLAAARKESRVFFSQFQDGQNTQRVADQILSEMKSVYQESPEN